MTTKRAKVIDDDAAVERLHVSEPKFRVATFLIRGISPYCQNKFSRKAREQMRVSQELGEKKAKIKKKEPKDFDECFKQATYISTEGWYGIPATSIRAAMVNACPLSNIKMTTAKKAFSIEPDGFDAEEQLPLIKFINGSPKRHESIVRTVKGTPDIRIRPLWEPGWEALVKVKFDSDIFTKSDIHMLLKRAGIQIGIGEGRPFSRKCAGIGWGLFEADPV